MIADGERLKSLLKKARSRVFLCAPFIKADVLKTILPIVPTNIPVQIYTRWRATEVAAGVSDLEVLEIANERPHTELRLLNNLHAKLYLVDDQCLVGSANLTASALGWSEHCNVELLIPAKPTDPDIDYLLRRLEAAEIATVETRLQIEALANTLKMTRLEEGEDMSDDSSRHQFAWLPRCAAPDKLYEIYANPKTTAVVTGTREDGLADITDLQIQPGLSEKDFKIRVRDTLLQIPTLAGIIDTVPQGLSDTDGIERIKEARPDLSEQDVRAQWRIVREWIGIFFEDQFEVAPESFVLRLKSRN
ncbi:MAG: phospholipase D family protein [Gammaproteobacteria bacterium]|nr:phospholipase D family protein [Gammaproteobacteria bacterium]MDE0284904.1 phospholipase D family protein [Gammaproteobacteria bacterium]MDE0513725.1 phospholipase D family protein [Gammaproteobacteria bacterium]